MFDTNCEPMSTTCQPPVNQRQPPVTQERWEKGLRGGGGRSSPPPLGGWGWKRGSRDRTDVKAKISSFVMVTTVRLLDITKNAVFHQSCKFLTVLGSVSHAPPTGPTLILVCWMQIMPLQPLLHPLPPQHPAPAAAIALAPAPTPTPTPTLAQTLLISLLLIVLPVLMRLIPQTMNSNCQQEAKVGRYLVKFCWMRCSRN